MSDRAGEIIDIRTRARRSYKRVEIPVLDMTLDTKVLSQLIIWSNGSYTLQEKRRFSRKIVLEGAEGSHKPGSAFNELPGKLPPIGNLRPLIDALNAIKRMKDDSGL